LIPRAADIRGSFYLFLYNPTEDVCLEVDHMESQSIELIRQYCVAFYHYDLKMHFKNYQVEL